MDKSQEPAASSQQLAKNRRRQSVQDKASAEAGSLTLDLGEADEEANELKNLLTARTNDQCDADTRRSSVKDGETNFWSTLVRFFLFIIKSPKGKKKHLFRFFI